MEWFRAYHGAPFDPKWRLIAIKAEVTVGHVVAVWWAMLDHASQATPRGSIEGFDPEVIAVAFDYDADAVKRIVTHCNAQGLVCNATIANWGKRQPQREDDSRERVQRHREKVQHNQEPSDCNALKRDVTHGNARTEQNREEQIRTDSRKKETRAERAPLDASTFAEFWVAWPNKVEKPAALRAYRKALARASPSEILDGVQRYIAAKPPDRPWLNPSTFLNRDRWTDEPAQLTDGNSFADKLAAIHRGAGLSGAAEHDDGRTIEGRVVAGG